MGRMQSRVPHRAAVCARLLRSLSLAYHGIDEQGELLRAAGQAHLALRRPGTKRGCSGGKDLVPRQHVIAAAFVDIVGSSSQGIVGTCSRQRPDTL
jgi:hypothetical protein